MKRQYIWSAIGWLVGVAIAFGIVVLLVPRDNVTLAVVLGFGFGLAGYGAGGYLAGRKE